MEPVVVLDIPVVQALVPEVERLQFFTSAGAVMLSQLALVDLQVETTLRLPTMLRAHLQSLHQHQLELVETMEVRSPVQMRQMQ